MQGPADRSPEFIEWAASRTIGAENWSLNEYKGKTATPTKDPRFTVEEAAEALLVSTRTIRRWLELPKVKSQIWNVAKRDYHPEPGKPKSGRKQLLYMFTGVPVDSTLEDEALSVIKATPTGMKWVVPNETNKDKNALQVNSWEFLTQVLDIPEPNLDISTNGLVNSCGKLHKTILMKFVMHYLYLMGACDRNTGLTHVIEADTLNPPVYRRPEDKQTLDEEIKMFRSFLTKAIAYTAGIQEILFTLLNTPQLFNLDKFAELELLDPSLSKEDYDNLTYFPQMLGNKFGWYQPPKKYGFDENLPWTPVDQTNQETPPISPTPPVGALNNPERPELDVPTMKSIWTDLDSNASITDQELEEWRKQGFDI